jgi:hypothetical protein
MFNGRRQPSGGGTSRMTRECQVRFCEATRKAQNEHMFSDLPELRTSSARLTCLTRARSRSFIKLFDHALRTYEQSIRNNNA